MEEFDTACTILNELQYKGIISKEEKMRRKALVLQYMEFAAAEYDDDLNMHSWGPMHELARCFLRCSLNCYSNCCGCSHSKAAAGARSSKY